MKTTVTLLTTFFHLASCLNLSADHINCVLYRTYTDYRVIKASAPEQIFEQDIFNPSLLTAIFIPGIPSPIDNPDIRPLYESYIRSKRYNLIQVSHDYYTPNRDSPGVYGEVLYRLGEILGSFISKLINIGLPLQSIELIGHSYGASLALLTAKNTFPKLPILVGLDPTPNLHFQRGYADYTIALHTNMGVHATRLYKDCDSNLIANGGTFQPKCPIRNLFQIFSEPEFNELNECYHRAALEYWGSMIENPELFYGVQCNDTDCNYNNIQLLGPNLRKVGLGILNQNITVNPVVRFVFLWRLLQQLQIINIKIALKPLASLAVYNC